MKSLGTVFKQVYSEGLKDNGFVKIKGRQPYFVRIVGGEIVHVITYMTRPSSIQGKKEFTIMGGVATVYRHCINLDESPKYNGWWLNTIGEFFKKKFLMTEPYENLNKWYSFLYDVENEESMIESVKYSLEVIKDIMMPILDEVRDLESCITHIEVYNGPNLNLYVDEHFGQKCNSGECNEGLLNFKLFNIEEFIARKDKQIKLYDKQMMYLISIGAIGYTLESYKEEQLRTQERVHGFIKAFEDIVNNPTEYDRVMKELERRKEFNVNKLKSYGIYV